VFVQAGSSVDGKAFAAQHAEAVFTAHQTLHGAQGFYADIKALAAANGRNPKQLLALPGMSPYLGSTEAEARALKQELDELTQPAYGAGHPAQAAGRRPGRRNAGQGLPAGAPR
jgi:alkanesulfonate monooxygenase SsuD/methylene tetrahydromethanopterin reductase-like flavin-dependent oxidoreductase (luciferase family)